MASLHDAVFYLFVIISAGMILVSLWDKHRQECTLNMKKVMEKPAKSVILAWALLGYCHGRALSILQWALKEGAEG